MLLFLLISALADVALRRRERSAACRRSMKAARIASETNDAAERSMLPRCAEHVTPRDLRAVADAFIVATDPTARCPVVASPPIAEDARCAMALLMLATPRAFITIHSLSAAR